MNALQDIRILDLTRLLPGAICTMLLADMGAQVIKVEDPNGGDYARWMPPMLDGEGAFFRASNRNKRSVIIDLKQERGQNIFHELVKSADVLVEGFRPGVTKRLRVDYDTLKAINPRLVYCSLSGWGQSGPYATMSGHDLNYVALNGLLGGMRTAQPLGGQIADVGGAYVGVMGILAALFKRERSNAGDYVDVALFEAGMPFAMYQWVESFVTGLSGGMGGLTGGAPFYDVYLTSDGQPVALASLEPKFWHNFCHAVHRPDWVERHLDPTIGDDLSALFKTRTADDWHDLLAGADCCFTHITAPADLANDPQVQARGMAYINDEGVPVMRSPVRLAGENPPPATTAPGYGDHTKDVLREAGLTENQLNELQAAGIIGRKASP